jgi:hypothetical protein
LDSSITKWVYPGPAKRVVFQTSTLTQSLLSEVQPIHLVPKDPNYAALDSLVYGTDGLTFNQATVSTEHPVAVVGPKRVQGCLKRNTPLASLRLSKDNHWPLTFIVPDSIADSFTKQPFEGDTAKGEWASKVDQYVLGLREATVWGRTQARNASLSMPDGDLISGWILERREFLHTYQFLAIFDEKVVAATSLKLVFTQRSLKLPNRRSYVVLSNPIAFPIAITRS